VVLTLLPLCVLYHADGTFLTASHAVGVGGGLTGVARPHSAHNHAHAGAHGHGHNHGEATLYYACRFAVCLLCALIVLLLLLCLRKELRSCHCSMCGSLHVSVLSCVTVAVHCIGCVTAARQPLIVNGDNVEATLHRV
jgi:hypothetical protein